MSDRYTAQESTSLRPGLQDRMPETPEIYPPEAGKPPCEIPAWGAAQRPAANPSPRPPPHTNTGTYRPLRGDVGSRRPEEGPPPPPSPPLRPRAACHRAPRSGEAAGPRGPEGRARSLARVGSLLHMEPAPGGVAGAWTVAAGRGLSAPLGTSRRRGPEARAKLSRKGGSRGPGAARGRRRGGSGDSAAGGARPAGRRPRPRRRRPTPRDP